MTMTAESTQRPATELAADCQLRPARPKALTARRQSQRNENISFSYEKNRQTVSSDLSVKHSDSVISNGRAGPLDFGWALRSLRVPCSVVSSAV